MTPIIHRSAAVLMFLTAGLAPAKTWAKPGPAPDVPPAVSGNVRYEVARCDPNQHGGCVVAYDNTSNAQLWAVQVYCTKYDPDLEEDAQYVFITSLTLDSNGRLQVSNQAGKHFTIDPTTQKVTGDARGCSENSSGCSYVPARSKAPEFLLFAAFGLLGVRRLRAQRSIG